MGNYILITIDKIINLKLNDGIIQMIQFMVIYVLWFKTSSYPSDISILH